MTLKELQTEVARRADTAGTEINAAVVARVIACTFDTLLAADPVSSATVIAKGLDSAFKRSLREGRGPRG